MKFFLDTANTDDIRKYAELGLVDGVTTNPTIVAREGRDFESVIKEITTIVDGPVSAEVTANEADKMIEQARALAKWADNIVVKIPMTEAGLKAVSVLSKEGIKTNVTLVFSVAQGLMAAKAGATFISPFVGRLDDIGSDGVKLIKDLRTVLDNYGLKSEIIAASIRGVQHVEAVALAGSDIATIPAGVFEKMFKHPLTDNGLASFEKDWAEFEASQK
ncbi:fructose-6-phosphate aldolase [Lactobacillus salivarius]|jgi:transaldolase|uniref:fructose-6-phosphate aldolase n=1 Tax=Ligilactobacillus salivarius TaxID=1624 RepID=UPI000B3AE71C|nr:fructose-6-phosphate aldolase [Ligilactobacillus salivarius]MDH4960684.1 fructose-6-phosphate aldolase [Ligilactobacillus salivarius]MDM8284361.1 fructose-6-phosphate aldolase [Ligilactobacillus salivarius]NME24761.1 fructose-6-phosphate aldolase [Ligilactobacillus salivarius]NXZ96636.1 fructose-6-phosphate aldolase [Ligilactobacillus salivarius]NYA59713.1 fructose-6-phosphate aldolase [Ligilactobacillus salivarius]